MRVPPLCSIKTPWAPAWGIPQLDKHEVHDLKRTVVLLLGRNFRDRTIEALGSGFIVGVSEKGASIVTAAHVLFGRFLNAVEGARLPVLDGLPKNVEYDFERLLAALNGRLIGITAATEVGDTPAVYELVVTGFSTGYDPRALDLAFLEATAMGSSERPLELNGMAPDFDALQSGQPVLLAGYAEDPKRPWKVAERDMADAVREWRKSLVVRAGLLAETTTRGEGARGNLPLMRITAPTLGNMSGGPVFHVRYPKGRVPLIAGAASPEMFASIGVISRGNPGGALLAYSQSSEGETWATPITSLRSMSQVPYAGSAQSFESLLQRGLIVDYSRLAEKSRALPPEPDSRTRTSSYIRYERTKGQGK